MSSGLVGAYAELESAVDKVGIESENVWQLHETDVVEVIRRNHLCVSKLQSFGLDHLTEARQRSIQTQGRPRPAGRAPSNTLLLCGHHHDSVHHHGWQVEFGADGHAHVIPPSWIDPNAA